VIRLHCTKKLTAKLPLLENGRLPNKRPSHHKANDDGRESPLSGWHANLLMLQRRQCVLLVHDSTRFPVFLPALKKADFAALDDRFADAFIKTLFQTDADHPLLQRAHAALAPLVIDNACNRSVQGTMNQMAQELAYSLEYEGAQVADVAGYRIGAWLAKRPSTVKGVKDCIWPVQSMRELLLSPEELALGRTRPTPGATRF